MAQENSSNALAQYGPVGAPIAGVVFLILFVAAIVMTSGISDGKDSLQNSVKAVRAKLEDTKVSPPKGGTIPLPDSVTATMQVGEADAWKPAAGSRLPLGMPIFWQVTMDAKPQDEFAQFDTNGDGSWDQIEFQQTSYFTGPAPRNEFKNWDRNQDGLISKEEYKDPPKDPTEAFAELDKSGDGFLTSKDGEITAEEERTWDRGDFDGKIDFQEYIDRYKPHDEVDVGAVENVAAKIDPATMEIVVTWDDPAVDTVPPDIQYFIERRAPETVEKRRSEYRKRVQKYTEALRAWEDRFDKWWNTTDAEGKKPNKQMWPKKSDAEKEYLRSTSDMKPVMPKEASDWEEVAGPISGNEYRDTSFETGVTYTYAVKMATQKGLKRGVKGAKDDRYPGWSFSPDRTVTAGHPVIVNNRIAMGFAGSSADSANISLAKWHSVVDESVDPPKVTWYRVQIVEKVDADNAAVGGVYTMTQLKDRGLKMLDIAGTEVNPQEILPGDTKIDFDTTYRFVAKVGANPLLSSRDLGDFELPKATTKEMQPSAPPSTDDAMEVRCLSVKSGGKEGNFEVTRWYKAGEDWLRVVWTGAVKTGADVGGEVKLGSPGSGVKIYDATGKEAPSSVLKAHKDETVDLAAGSYDGLDERSVSVGGESFDLFGTLYK
ncbi:MAG: hypothetical protein H6839_09480 [Planctomycetes bacterium]|nr:hypothetical protein [Planctomycetota bacterium]